MPIDPREPGNVYDDIRNRLTDKLALLTNFVSGGFNDEWVSAYSEQVYEAEVKALAAQLSGYVDYAGKEITEQDLNRLGVTGVDPADVNEYQEDQHLDELGKLVGVRRGEGSRATGQVTFQVSSDSVDITEGTSVGTEPSNDDGSFLEFRVDATGNGTIDGESTESVSPDTGETEVTVDIVAEEVGDEYNVGAGMIEYIPSPQPGIESVTNNAETTGGEDQQSNASLREDVKNAVFESSGGGTELGIQGYVESNSTDEVDVGIDEFVDREPPFVDVIVDGGSESEIQTLIDESRPVGIQHNLIRPSTLSVGVKAEVIGDSVDNTDVTTAITGYLTDLSVGDLFSSSVLTQRITTSDTDIVSVPATTTYITSVSRELHTYQSGTNVYEVEYPPVGTVYDEGHVFRDGVADYQLMYHDVDQSSVEVEAIVDDQRTQLDRGTDFEVQDVDGDGNYDSIVLLDSVTPDLGTTMLVSYEHNLGSVDSIVDDSETEYVEGTDYAVIDDNGDGRLDSIDWSPDGASPDDGERFFVDYTPNRTFRGDLSVSERKKVQADTNVVSVDSYTQ